MWASVNSVGCDPTAYRGKERGMATNGRIAMFLLLAASMIAPTGAGFAAEHQWLHRKKQSAQEASYGTVHVVDGVLRGGSLDIPKEGLTLDEAVARSLRAGAKLASSQWGADIPVEDGTDVRGKSGERWYVVVTRNGQSQFIPASLVQYSSLGSCPLMDRDVVSVADAKILTEEVSETPVVKVASLLQNGAGVAGPAALVDRGARRVNDVFGEGGLGGYAAVHREVAGVRGTFILQDADKQFRFRSNDVVHWVHPDSLHASLLNGRRNQVASHERACLDAMPRKRDAHASTVDRMRGRVVAPFRAASNFLRIPNVF